MNRAYAVTKRALDLALALLLLAPAGAVMALCAAAIKLESPGPVFFRQRRIGRNGRAFDIYKLRTMHLETERNGHALSDMERMTRCGRVLRSLSLDELAQLFNILRGEMSFVGPRPLLAEYWPLYTDAQRRRHEAPPGISGWAQVNGRNTITWAERLAHDVWYVDHACLALDLKIAAMTVRNVLRREGINSGAGQTMEHFRGSAEEAQ